VDCILSAAECTWGLSRIAIGSSGGAAAVGLTPGTPGTRLLEQALQDTETALGLYHPQTAAAHLTACLHFQDIGDAHSAARCARVSLEVFAHVYGQHHHATRSAYQLHAVCEILK
jgi:hypothetical protein